MQIPFPSPHRSSCIYLLQQGCCRNDTQRHLMAICSFFALPALRSTVIWRVSHQLWSWNHAFGQKRGLSVGWSYSSLTCCMVSSCYGGMVEEVSWAQTQGSWPKACRGCPWLVSWFWSRHFCRLHLTAICQQKYVYVSRSSCGKGLNKK